MVIVLWQDCTVDLGCFINHYETSPLKIHRFYRNRILMANPRHQRHQIWWWNIGHVPNRVCYQKEKKNIHLPFTSQFRKLHQNWYWFNAPRYSHLWFHMEWVKCVGSIVGSAWMNTNSRGMIHQSMSTAEMQISFSGMLQVIANLDLIETTTIINGRYVIAQMKTA